MKSLLRSNYFIFRKTCCISINQLHIFHLFLCFFAIALPVLSIARPVSVLIFYTSCWWSLSKHTRHANNAKSEWFVEIQLEKCLRVTFTIWLLIEQILTRIEQNLENIIKAPTTTTAKTTPTNSICLMIIQLLLLFSYGCIGLERIARLKT